MAGSITVLCGLSCSGKSTWVRKNGWSYVVLCPDEFRRILHGHDFYGAAEEFVWGSVKTAARVLAGPQKRDILIDATAITVGQRGQWVRIAKEIGVPIICFVFDVPLEVCLERNQARKRKVPDDVLNRQADLFEFPTEDEGFASVRKVESEDKSSN
jgi:predicted kinase